MHCPYCLYRDPFHAIDCIHAAEHDRYPEDRYMEFVRALRNTPRVVPPPTKEK